MRLRCGHRICERNIRSLKQKVDLGTSVKPTTADRGIGDEVCEFPWAREAGDDCVNMNVRPAVRPSTHVRPLC